MDDVVSKIKNHSKNIRRIMLDTALEAGARSSHFGGGLSTVEILASLYGYKMNYNRMDMTNEKRDRFILSKGHGCLSYYAALAEFNIINKESLMTFEKFDSKFLGHPVINRKLGIEFSTGSLGMGLSLGIGVAIASHKLNLKYNTYVIIGDGECNEGSIWEAAMFAASNNIKNLTLILDHNKFQQTGSVNEIIDTKSLLKKWDSFGWSVVEIDGHNIKNIIEALDLQTSSPKIIIANTVKGKGFSFSENNNDWHHAVLSKSFYDKAIQELEKNDI